MLFKSSKISAKQNIESQVLKLPCKRNVASVLEGFVRYYAHSLVQKHTARSRVAHRANSSSSTSGSNTGELVTTGTQMNLCKEYADGIRVTFDFLLAVMLLYPEERSQFSQLKEKNESCKSEEGNQDNNAVPSSEQ